MFQRKWLPIWIAMPILIVGIYRAYLSDENLKDNGIYTAAKVVRTRYARGGIRVWSTFHYKGATYEKDGIHPIPENSMEGVGNRFFVTFLPNAPQKRALLTRYRVPDSLNAPDTGWSREWMKEHFPEVISSLEK